jgi:decaprenylphospho-beta-D-ribofuranose 2-oxidase
VGTVDERTGEVEVDAGATLAEVMRRSVPAGWLPAVLPGTSNVTVGGAIAADIHGKNHPEAGAFSACVQELVLLSPARGRLTVSRTSQPEVFWSTVGGLGLTGVILRARLRLTKIETAWMVCTDRFVPDLAGVLSALNPADGGGSYLVAWLNGHAGGAHLGRGIVSQARHASLADLPARRRSAPLHHRSGGAVPVPRLPGPGLVNTPMTRVANVAHEAPPRLGGGRQRRRTIANALHPLDGVDGWPGLYGRRGLIQYQFVVPFGAEAVLESALELPRRAGCPPSLAVLKRLGRPDPAPLSFPTSGWTLALDFPARASAIAAVLDDLDEKVAGAGGRIYLVKDARLRADLVESMYPLIDQWRTIRERLDPDHVLASDLDRRLDLTGRRAS